MDDQLGSVLFEGILLLIILAFFLLLIVSTWIVFTKANQPGWGCLIPIFNIYLALQVAGLSGWWLLIVFIPPFDIIPVILISIGIARNFGKGFGFALGLMFLPFIFLPILAFGDAEYSG